MYEFVKIDEACKFFIKENQFNKKHSLRLMKIFAFIQLFHSQKFNYTFSEDKIEYIKNAFNFCSKLENFDNRFGYLR